MYGTYYFSNKIFFTKIQIDRIAMDMNLNVEAAENFAAENWIDPVSNTAN